MSSRPASLFAVSLFVASAGCSQPPGFVTDVSTVDAADTIAMTDVAPDVQRDIPPIPIMDTGPLPDMTIVYAHSDTTLYTVDPHTTPARFTTVGDFTFAAGDTHRHTITDLAVDATGGVVGVSQDALFRIDPTNAACTFLAVLPARSFVALTYVPAGVLDPTSEVLVGGESAGTYFRIDPITGNATQLGAFQGGWLLSGDFVSIAGAATYVTVRRSSSGTDSLATLDLATGNLTILGDTGFHQLFGLGYWRSTLYGFSGSGQLVTIDVRNGLGHLVSMPVMQFWGAGVTTLAPIAPG